MKETANQEKRNHVLDVIRLISALGILLLHYESYLVGDGMWFGKLWIDAGKGAFDFQYFAEIFFVLSGYLHQAYIKRIRSGLRFPEYIRGKLIRILPMMAITVIVYEVFLKFLFLNGKRFWLAPYEPNLWGIIVAILGVADCWCFINGGTMNPAWYLSGLLLCYVLFYFILFYADRKKIHENYLFTVMVIIGCSLLAVNTNLPFLGPLNGRAYCAFFIGVLLAAVLEKYKPRRVHLILSLLVLILLGLALVFFPGFMAFGQVFIVAFMFAPASIILSYSSVLQRIFAWKGWGLLGKCTFSIYLWHLPLMLIVLDVLDWNGLDIRFQQSVVFAAFLLLMILWSIVSYYLLERPITKRLVKRYADMKSL